MTLLGLWAPIVTWPKLDIEAAYRHVPIDPYDWDKTAFCWPTDALEDLYFDGYLQFGLKNACEVFNSNWPGYYSNDGSARFP
jgi:hypothetical protein